MKRFLLLSALFVFFIHGYGQHVRTKQVRRIPADSAAVQSSVKGKDALVIDGSQNVQTRSGGKSSSPFSVADGQERLIPEDMNLMKAPAVGQKLKEPQSVFIERERSQLRSSIAGGAKEAAFAFLRETPQLNIPNPELQIRIDTIETDHLDMTHLKGTQLFHNIPVYGMNFTFHISYSSEVFMGYTIDSTHINTVDAARYSADDAVRIATHDLSLTTKIQTPGEFMKKNMNYEHPAVAAIYYPNKSNVYNYCYRVVIRPNMRDEWIYFIDAHSGEVVDKYNNTRTDGPNTGSGKDLKDVSRTVNTYLENGTHLMINATKPMYNAAKYSGTINIYDAKNSMKFHETGAVELCTNTSTNWNNPHAISAMYHTNLIYDYFQSTFKRNSFDNKGANMLAVINVCDDEDGGGYDNAYWNGSYVALGNGSIVYLSLATALDVIAHEFGHAVVGSTADFDYRNQSGAIDEAYADIFAAMIDRTNWTMGEDIVKNRYYYPTGFMRDMRNPHNGGTKFGDRGWQPAHVSEMYLGTDDRGGVHINNSIPAHTFYVYATSTSKEKAEQVYYRALTTYLTPTSKFIDLRKAVIQAAKDLSYSGDLQILSGAFDKVGIVDESSNNPPPPPPDLPSNPGEWGMLVCSTDPGDRNSLYKTTDYRSLSPVSTTEMYSTPSVTDDGKYAIFVDNNYNIRLIDMAAGTERTINSEGDNQSVAISRDGKRMAVVSTSEDARIWVFDFISEMWQPFILYNPTTGSGGARSGGPRFADALEFNHTGEYLIYDAYNVVGSTLGNNTLDYWDIGLIHVWDNNRNTWGTGEVEKLFTDLSPGVNVFNPVFSKNSPFIIAFDFYSEEEDENYTLGVNLVTGAVVPMISNNMPSYPSYSMDDKHIAFTTRNYYDRDEYNVGYFNLDNDKLNLIGDETVFASGVGYTVYYGTGSRVLGAKPAASFTADDRSGGAPLLVQFVDMSNGNPASWRWTFQGGSPSSSTQQHPAVAYTRPGTYAVTLSVTNSYGSGEVTQQAYITVGDEFKVGQRVIAGRSVPDQQFAASYDTPQPDFNAMETVAVFPNPTNDYVWVVCDTDKPVDIKLFDLTGKAIPAAANSEQGKTRLDVARLQRGIYILHVTLSDGRVETRKVVKN